ncbi:MAG: 4Fe-4S dicluster domain-containing protein [Anaerolineae bacterium]|nr:4Fe-4S dicluster domain-containing protein [Anaerolineae bacterium]
MTEQPNMPVPQIDNERCTGCELCVRVCPTKALTMKDGLALVTNPNACTYVGHCERICPTQAISRPFQIILHPDIVCPIPSASSTN